MTARYPLLSEKRCWFVSQDMESLLDVARGESPKLRSWKSEWVLLSFEKFPEKIEQVQACDPRPPGWLVAACYSIFRSKRGVRWAVWGKIWRTKNEPKLVWGSVDLQGGASLHQPLT